MWLPESCTLPMWLHLWLMLYSCVFWLEGDMGQVWRWGWVKQSGKTSPNSITLEQDCKEVKEGAACVPGKKHPDRGRARGKRDNLCHMTRGGRPRGGASVAIMTPWAPEPGLIFTALLSHHMITFFFFVGHAACGVWAPQSGINPAPPGAEAWLPNHWTTRGLPP